MKGAPLLSEQLPSFQPNQEMNSNTTAVTDIKTDHHLS